MTRTRSGFWRRAASERSAYLPAAGKIATSAKCQQPPMRKIKEGPKCWFNKTVRVPFKSSKPYVGVFF
jgi:hypothetical protein